MSQSFSKRKSHFTESNEGKIPSQSLLAEEGVLGGILLESDALSLVEVILKTPEVFYSPQHQSIYAAIIQLRKTSKPIDLITVTEQLRKMEKLDEAGGPFYITQLTNKVASAANIEFHCHEILESYMKRSLFPIGVYLQNGAFDQRTDVFELQATAAKMLDDLNGVGVIEGGAVPMHISLTDTLEKMENTKMHEGVTGIPTGFRALDNITAGWQGSDLIILAARPGMGKTSFMLQEAINAAEKNKKCVIFTLEMSRIQLTAKMISNVAGINSEQIKKGMLSPDQWSEINTAVGRMADYSIYIDDTPAITVSSLKSKARKLHREGLLDIMFIDYLQLMNGTEGNDGKRGFREQEISYITGSLKSLAKELDIPIIALSQLSREVEKRGGKKKPILADLRESGSIEQDADAVIFIYRPEYYEIYEDEAGNSTKDAAEIIFAKHRNGALETAILRFIKEISKFTYYDYDEIHIAKPKNEQVSMEFKAVQPPEFYELKDDEPF